MSDNWIEVKKKIKQPSIINRNKAFSLQRSLDIEGLAHFLLSEPISNLQKEGWRFYKVLKGNATDYENSKKVFLSENYKIIPIGNTWNDSCVFIKSNQNLEDNKE